MDRFEQLRQQRLPLPRPEQPLQRPVQAQLKKKGSLTAPGTVEHCSIISMIWASTCYSQRTKRLGGQVTNKMLAHCCRYYRFYNVITAIDRPIIAFIVSLTINDTICVIAHYCVLDYVKNIFTYHYCTIVK